MTRRERLTMLEADPTLRYTGVRWLAHEAVYPGSGALEEVERYRERDVQLLVEVEASVAEFERCCPGDEATVYMRWLRDELRRSLQRERAPSLFDTLDLDTEVAA